MGLRLSSHIRRVPGMTMALPPHSAAAAAYAPPRADPRRAPGEDRADGAAAGGPPTAMFELQGNVMHWRIPPGALTSPFHPPTQRTLSARVPAAFVSRTHAGPRKLGPNGGAAGGGTEDGSMTRGVPRY